MIQAAWLHVRDGDSIYRLNADAKRKGVEDDLAIVDRLGNDVPWTVVPNRKGRMNAVAFGPNQERVRRFYLYDLDG